MVNRSIDILRNRCVECGSCAGVCHTLDEARSRPKNTVRPAFLHCIYCQGDCTEICDQNALRLIDLSGPHTVLCRDKYTNNFVEE